MPSIFLIKTTEKAWHEMKCSSLKLIVMHDSDVSITHFTHKHNLTRKGDLKLRKQKSVTERIEANKIALHKYFMQASKHGGNKCFVGLDECVLWKFAPLWIQIRLWPISTFHMENVDIVFAQRFLWSLSLFYVDTK